MPTPISQSLIEFRRRIDVVVYRYRPCEPRNGFFAWKREDLDLWLVWDKSLGWVGKDDKGEVVCVPWAVPVGEQGSAPPPGVWVSRKGAKSYVYDLVYAAGVAAI